MEEEEPQDQGIAVKMIKKYCNAFIASSTLKLCGMCSYLVLSTV